MSAQPKLIPLINELSKRTLYTPLLTSIDPLTPSENGYPHNLRLVYAQQNYRESTPLKGSTYLNFDPSNNPAITEVPTFTSVENDILTDTYSPSRELRALFRKGTDKVVLEIWTKSGLWKSLRVSDFHDSLYADSVFCLTTIVWSEDEKKILYIAEKKEEKSEKYFDVLDNEEQLAKTFEKFEYKQELGEGYRGRKNPLVFIYDIEQEQLFEVLNIPKDIIPTYVSFTDNQGNGIVFCGIDFRTMKLGVRFCSNRPSQIYYVEQLVLLKAEKKKNSDGKREREEKNAERKKKEAEVEKKIAFTINKDAISTCPVLSKDKTKLVYFFSPWKTSHTMGFGMKVLKFADKAGNVEKEELIFDVVQERRKADEFPGVTGFVDILSKVTWINERYIVFNTYAGCSVGVFIVDTETKEIRRIDQGKYRSEEWLIKRFYDGNIVLTISNMDGGSRIGIFNGINLQAGNLQDLVKDAKWHTYELQINGFDNTIVSSLEQKYEIYEKIIEVDGIESLFFGAKETKTAEGVEINNKSRPLVLFLHGGPHAVYTGISTVLRQYLINQGYNLLMPAFTGSLGYGQKFIEDLLGKIGEIDVEEIMKSLDYCIKEGLCDGSRVVIFGGSYGGYLCGVLMAKFSERFKGAIILNPVTNSTHLWTASDIPEWNTSEILNKDTIFDVTPDEIKKMYDMSPISMYKGKEVKGSILLLLGEKDKRVHWGGGLQYYNMLKRKGADIKLLTYAEGEHSLAGVPEMEFDVLIQTANFLNEKFGQ